MNTTTLTSYSSHMSSSSSSSDGGGGASVEYNHVGIYNSLLSLFLISHTVVWFVLFRLRAQEPFASRRLKWTIISNIGGLIMVIVICMREQNPASFSCALYVVLSNAFVYLYSSGYVVRAVWLRYMHSWNKEVCEYQDVTEFNHKRKASRYRNFILLFLCVAFAVHITVVIMEVLRLAHNSGKNYMTHGCWMDVELEVFLIQFAVYLAIMICMVMIIIRVSDAYWISTELRLCMLCWLLFGSLFFLFTLLPGMNHVVQIFPQSSWLLIAIGLTFVISDVAPLLVYWRAKRQVKISHNHERYHRFANSFVSIDSDSANLEVLPEDEGIREVGGVDVETAGDVSSDLESIIDNPKLCTAFQQMMMYWLRAEIFQFCVDVHKLRQGKVENDKLEWYCRTLYQKYLAKGSHSGNSVKDLSKVIELLAADVHAKLERNEVTSDMFDNIYPHVKENVEKMLIWFDPDSSSGTPFLTPYRLFC